MFFSDEDCELFNEENKYSLDKKICEKRQILHKKLCRLHGELYLNTSGLTLKKKLEKDLGLHCHPLKNHLTNEFIPRLPNSEVNQIRLSYGYSKEDINKIKKNNTELAKDITFTHLTQLQFFIDCDGCCTCCYIDKSDILGQAELRKILKSPTDRSFLIDLLHSLITQEFEIYYGFYDNFEYFDYDSFRNHNLHKNDVSCFIQNFIQKLEKNYEYVFYFKVCRTYFIDVDDSTILRRCYTENATLIPFSDKAIENTYCGIAQMIIDDFSLLIRLFNFIKIPNTSNAKRK